MLQLFTHDLTKEFWLFNFPIDIDTKFAVLKSSVTD